MSGNGGLTNVPPFPTEYRASGLLLQTELGHLRFIAEDLGLITPDVQALRDQFQMPGTRVLQFAFDGHPDNPYFRTTFSLTRSSIPVRMTMPRLDNGMRNCPISSGRICGVTSSVRRARVGKLLPR